MRSIRFKIFAGFLACVGVAVFAFGIVTTIALQFQKADGANRAAVAASQKAAALESAARTVEAALLQYQVTVSNADRNHLNTKLEQLMRLSDSEGDLLNRANKTSELIQTMQVGASTLLDSVSSLASPVVTLGEAAANINEPNLVALVVRLDQAYAMTTSGTGRYLSFLDGRSIEMLKDSIARMQTNVAAISATPGLSNRLKKVSAVIARDVEVFSKAFDAHRAALVARTDAMAAFKGSIQDIVASSNARLQKAQKESDDLGRTAQEASAFLMLSMFTAAPTVLLLGIMLAFAIGRSISRPMLSLTESVEKIAAGNYEVDVPCQNERNELGTLSRAVLVLRNESQEKVRLEIETQHATEAANREREAREAEKAREAAEAQATIHALADSLGRLSRGDLVCEIDTPFVREFEQLRTDFNSAVVKLRETMETVVARTSAITSNSAEISNATDALSGRTEQQAASLEETAAAIDEIAATGRKAAEGARHARESVSNAKHNAEKTGEVVRQTVEAMSNIEKSAREINQIIGVIDEIAFQTNLLALNAGVEAARAGDAGRGFAVVASEVRALAQRSAQAAREIKQLISASSSQVSAGVDLVAEAGKALREIVQQVTEINEAVVDIAAGAQEQSTGLQQVNSAINELDRATQQNAAMVEETTAASHHLSAEAANLSTLMAQFRLSRKARLAAAA